jgi:Na+-driven multidrug efflux pump
MVRQVGLLLPALLILPRFLGINGAWIALPLSDAGGAIVAGLWLYREYVRQKRSGIWETPPVSGPVPEPMSAELPSTD